jgi:hypothetical protein
LKEIENKINKISKYKEKGKLLKKTKAIKNAK